jgi:hypothetical protein
MMITMSRFYEIDEMHPDGIVTTFRSTRPQLAELDDVRMLRPERRTFGDVSTWAWDTHDELVGLLCLSCGDVSDGHEDRYPPVLRRPARGGHHPVAGHRRRRLAARGRR